jgi:hypothetical protein
MMADASQLPAGDAAALQTMVGFRTLASAADRRIISRLEQAAGKGDVAAARELREWRKTDPSAGAGIDALRLAVVIGQLSGAQRRQLLELVTAVNAPADAAPGD